MKSEDDELLETAQRRLDEARRRLAASRRDSFGSVLEQALEGVPAKGDESETGEDAGVAGTGPDGD